MALDIKEINRQIKPAFEDARLASEQKWDGIAKPLKGLGYLEEMVTKIAALTGDVNVSLKKRCVLVTCADNGVVAEGVTQTDSSVTAIMAGKIRDHMSSVCLMARTINVDPVSIDAGMLVRVPGTVDMHVADGTGNIAKGPAMSREQALQAIENGISLVKTYKDKGYDIIATGEMGIGNTTTSSAATAVLTEAQVFPSKGWSGR